MDLSTLTQFFLWCTIINGGVLIFWSIACVCLRGFMYRVHSKIFPMSRETHTAIVYSFLGMCKIIFVFFNAGPLVALLIIR